MIQELTRELTRNNGTRPKFSHTMRRILKKNLSSVWKACLLLTAAEMLVVVESHYRFQRNLDSLHIQPTQPPRIWTERLKLDCVHWRRRPQSQLKSFVSSFCQDSRELSSVPQRKPNAWAVAQHQIMLKTWLEIVNQCLWQCNPNMNFV